MDFTLELVVVPVTDVDRAKAFYSEQCGFNVDVDQSFGDTFRVVQLTPPGSTSTAGRGTRSHSSTIRTGTGGPSRRSRPRRSPSFLSLRQPARGGSPDHARVAPAPFR